MRLRRRRRPGTVRDMRASSALLAAALLCLSHGPALAAPAPGSAAAPAQVIVKGEDGHTVTLGVHDLDALPQATAGFTHEGKSFSFHGPPLAEVLKRVGAPLGPDMRGPALSDVVILTAADGYVVTLALSDLEPSIRADSIILADATADGSPLGADGPLRLVVGGDLKPARSARSIVSIEVRRLRAP